MLNSPKAIYYEVAVIAKLTRLFLAMMFPFLAYSKGWRCEPMDVRPIWAQTTRMRNVLQTLLFLAILSGATLSCRQDARAQIERLPQPVMAVDFQEPVTLENDEYYEPTVLPSAAGYTPAVYVEDDTWSWQVLPDGILYKSYLAGAKESRLSTQYFSLSDGDWMWDSTLGGRFGLFRYGTQHDFLPQGLQMDLEGAAQVRLDPGEDRDVRSVDFRAGGYLAYGWDRHQIKFGYYHLSSHVGDEFLLKNMGFMRLNYVRDALVLGYSYYPRDNLRLYAEAAWAFVNDVADPWEFQFGVDWAPAHPTGPHGAPFAAINGHLREELNFGGNIAVQAGWAWRSDEHGHLFRVGLHYYNGASNQWSFFDEFEHQIGVGLWYDF